jgi:LysM repeat protein
MPDNFVSPSDLLVRQLRRRLWLERVFWLIIIGLAAAVHFGALPGGRRAILITANGQPVTVVGSRSEANRLLDDLRSPSSVPGAKVTFAETVALHSVPASRNPIQSDSEAMRALAAKLHPVVRASAIVTNGEVVLGLPDQKEAVRTLSDILRHFSPPGENTTVYFKEQVKIETRDVPPEKLYPNAEKALARIAEASAPKGEYEVKPGDSAWKIAQRFSVPLSRLGAANPEVDMNRVLAGQKLKIPGELPPLTVIARKEIEERLGEGPFAAARKIRITYENGAEVNREIVGRQQRRAPSGPPRRTRSRRGAAEVIR